MLTVSSSGLTHAPGALTSFFSALPRLVAAARRARPPSDRVIRDRPISATDMKISTSSKMKMATSINRSTLLNAITS